MNYDNGFIYRIDGTDASGVALTYIGSSCLKSCAVRMAGHKAEYKRYKDGREQWVSSFPILECEDCRITLVEKWPCASKDELHAREQYYIDTIQCVNKKKAYTGLTRPDYKKQYYEENREKIKEYKRQYNEAHKEQKKEYNHQYREANKERLNEQRRQYYEENKEKILEYKHQYYLKKKLNQNQQPHSN